jgi:beta-galactosidase
LVGTLDRRLNQATLPVHVEQENTRLDILVENTGRVNFGREFTQERAGITHQVTLGNKALSGWKIYPLPMEDVTALPFRAAGCTGACFYRARFDVKDAADTFIDTGSLHKGAIFINGHALGRFWSIGPQKSLYLPGPWLHKGENEMVVFDLEGAGQPTLGFLGHSVLGENGK